MTGDGSSALLEGAIIVLERKGANVFITGWFRPGPDATTGAAELHIGPPDEAPTVWPLRRQRSLSNDPTAQGFQVMMPVPGEWSALLVSIVHEGATLCLTPKPRVPIAFRRRGGLDEPGRMGISGWVFDTSDAQPVLLVNDRLPIPLALNRARPDLPFDLGEEQRNLGFHLTLEELGEAIRAQDPTASLMDGASHGVTLLLGGLEQHHRTFSHLRRLGGALERTKLPFAEGWASEAEPGTGPVTIDVLLEGTRWLTIPAQSPRPDLLVNGIGRSQRGGAFRLPLPQRNPGGSEAPQMALQPAHGRGLLPGAAPAIGMQHWRVDRSGILDTPAALRPAAVTVIIPIHNAADDLARCIEAVLRHTTGPTSLLLIDDASTDPGIGKLLALYAGRAGIQVLRNDARLGFAATCNRGIRASGGDDVVLLNSDTVVGPNWLGGLRLAAAGTAQVGSVTPLSNNAGAFSVPELHAENRFPPWFSPEDMARLARQASLALWPEVPTGNGFCLYIRRACLAAVGLLDAKSFPRGYGEENDFCLRAQRAGFIHLLDDRTLVWHRRGASFAAEREALLEQGKAVIEARYPEYQHMTRVFADGPALLALRWRVRRAVEASQRAGRLPRPRILFVISTEAGGTPLTNGDLMGALSDRYEPWLLRCEAGKMQLGPMGEAPLESHVLDMPISPATHRSLEYDRRVADLLIRHGIELVHIRHIAWHGLGLPEICRRLGIPVVFSFHDFYTACPTVKLLDAEGRFCGGQCTKGAADCTAELWRPGEMPPLRGRFVHRWRAMMADALAVCDAFVTTSNAARETLLQTFPFLESKDLWLIPHGRDFPRLERLAVAPLPDEPLRVLVPGHIFAAKGSALVIALAQLDAGREVEFHIIGDVDDQLRQPRPGIVLHGPYLRDSFAEKVRTIRPHLGAVFSIWPETWCHTLTECWAAGLPVLTLDLGAQAERIRATGAGWILPLDEAPEEILAWLMRLKRDPEELREHIGQVQNWQCADGRHQDSLAMAATYDELYQEVLDRCRSFATSDSRENVPVLLELRGRSSSLGGPPPMQPGMAIVRRPVRADFPFARTVPRQGSRPAAGRPSADLVLLGPAALEAQDLPRLIMDCHEACLPLLVYVDGILAEALAAPAGAEARAALARDEVTLVATRPVIAKSLQAMGLSVRPNIVWRDPRAWQAPLPLEPALPPGCLAACRVLVLDAGGGASTPMGALLEELSILGVTELWPWREEGESQAGQLPPGTDSVTLFRQLARDCDFAVLTRFACDLAADPLVLAAIGEGLPVLVRRDLVPKDEPPPPGVTFVPTDADACARVMAEFAAEPVRRRVLGRAGVRHFLHEPRRDAWLAGWQQLIRTAIGESS